MLQKQSIDRLEANRRAILAVTRRRFKDEDVAEGAWRVHRPSIVEAIQRKVFEDPKQAATAIKIKTDSRARKPPPRIQPSTGGRDSDRGVVAQPVDSEYDDEDYEEDEAEAAPSYTSPEHSLDKIKTHQSKFTRMRASAQPASQSDRSRLDSSRNILLGGPTAGPQ